MSHLRCRVPGRNATKIQSLGRSQLRLEIVLVALLAFSAIVAAGFGQLTAAQDNSLSPAVPQSEYAKSPRADSLGSVVSSASLQSPTLSAAAPNKDETQFVPGEVLVRFRSETAAAKKGTHSEMLFEPTRGQFLARIERVSEGPEIVPGLRLARVAPAETLSAIAALSSRPDVLYAEPNYIKRVHLAPNDLNYGAQWALKNTGQTDFFVLGTPGADIDAELAWDITTGSRSVVVGVIDTGMLVENHLELSDNIWRNPGEIPGNGIDDDGNGYIDDMVGWDFANNKNTVFDGTLETWYIDYHGTHVAGTIGALSNNGQGVAGVNWQVSIMPLKFIGPNGGSMADLLGAFNYARMMRKLWIDSGGTKGANIRVLNNSYGGYFKSQSEVDAIQALADAGILFVVSAGNDGRSTDIYPEYPADLDLPNIISVAATDRRDLLPYFSNFGPRTVHIGAPGSQIWSTVPAYSYTAPVSGSCAMLDGTSMAAPHVTGTAALILAEFPDISMQRLRAAILYGGDVTPALENRTVTGRRLNAYGSLQNAADVDTTPPASVTNFRIVNQDSTEVILEWTAPGDDGDSGGASVYELRYTDSAPADAQQFHTGYWLPAPLPLEAGSTQRATVRIPFQHSSGFISLRSIDNAGNSSQLSHLPVSVNEVVANPYVITEGGTENLSTGGTPLGLRADDKFKLDYPLPFPLPIFGHWTNQVTISTNGALYFPAPPQFHGPSLLAWTPTDADGTVEGLEHFMMVAGLWDDLRTDLRPSDDIYVVTPDQDRIIFRWQGVTFDTPLDGESTRGEHPVNFEIELQRNGTIQLRYGDGNTRLFPVVGLSGASADANLIASHSSKLAFKDLTNAASITFALRAKPVPPPTDLVITMALQGHPSGNPPDLVISGQNLTYVINVTNTSPDSVVDVVVTDPLPAGATFVSCTSDYWPCSLSGGQVIAKIGRLGRTYSTNSAKFSITVRLDAPNSTIVKNTATVTSHWPDSTPEDNSATATALVAERSRFDNVRSVATGIAHTVALKNDGTVWAWGQNDSGSLGLPVGGFAWRPYPGQVPSLTGVTMISAGGAHSLALKNDGSVWGWGNDQFGQIGTKQSHPHDQFTPLPISGLSNIHAISAGEWYSLFIKADRTLWALGHNETGQLGDGTYADTEIPVRVTGLTEVVAASGGPLHSIAARIDGTVWTWGFSGFGALGNGQSPSFRNTPFQVPGISGVIQVDAGDNFSVVLRSDGTVWAWGRNYNGQLGDGSNEDRLSPVQSSGLTNVAAISTFGNYCMALKSDGTVWAWGQGPMRLSDNNIPENHVPTQIPGLEGVVAIEAGRYTGYAVMSDGTVRALGRNGPGLYGDGSSETPTTFPVQVSSIMFVDTPVFSIDGFNYPVPVNVYISSTEGATIHYTTNGNDPTESDPVVISGSYVRVDHSLTLKARAWKSGWTSSRIRTAVYTVTPKGNGKIAFGSIRGNQPGTHIYVMEADGTNQIQLTDQSDGSPAWSPDGAKLAFVRSSANSSDIFVVNADGTHAVKLTNSVESYFYPAWSPDGTQLAVERENQLYAMKADGTDLRRLTYVNAHDTTPVWSPDATRIAFARSQEGQSAIYVKELNVANARKLTTNTADELWPAWSPDGRKIAFSFSGGIYVIDVDGANQTRLTNSLEGQDTKPAWSPDGSKIAFARGNASIWTMNSDGSNQLLLSNQTDSYPSWQPVAGSTVLNPIDDARTFVHQHYLDFLSRTPDSGGLTHWTGEITECSDFSKRQPGESLATCTERKRSNTSAAFFLSPEFQNTGSFVVRVYWGTLGKMANTPSGSQCPSLPSGLTGQCRPLYSDYVADVSQVARGIVVNDQLDPNVINANKQAFVDQFVNTAAFKAKYDSLNDQQFVDTLFQTTGINASASDRAALVNELNAGAPNAKSSVVFKVVDGTTTQAGGALVFNTTYGKAFYDKEFDDAFVFMEYIGYLRRNPDQGGYDFWLGKLKQYGNWMDAQMVLAFISSPEYRSRFDP